jgi:hypothetical protein
LADKCAFRIAREFFFSRPSRVITILQTHLNLDRAVELYIMAEEESRRTSVTAAAAAVTDAEFVAKGTASASRAEGL